MHSPVEGDTVSSTLTISAKVFTRRRHKNNEPDATSGHNGDAAALTLS